MVPQKTNLPETHQADKHALKMGQLDNSTNLAQSQLDLQVMSKQH